MLDNARAAAGCLLRHPALAVYDTETTGVTSDDKIIQFGGVILAWDGCENRYKITDHLCTLSNPGIPIPEEASKVNGIYDSDVKDAPPQEDLAHMIQNFFGKAEVVCGYNSIKFDNGFIRRLFKRHLGVDFSPKEQIDALKIAREIIRREELTDGSYKLCNVATYYGVNSGNFHDAMGDVVNTYKIIFSEVNHYNRDYAFPRYADVHIMYQKRFTKSHKIDYTYFDFEYRDRNDKTGTMQKLAHCRYDHYSKSFSPEIKDPVSVANALFAVNE